MQTNMTQKVTGCNNKMSLVGNYFPNASATKMVIPPPHHPTTPSRNQQKPQPPPLTWVPSCIRVHTIRQKRRVVGQGNRLPGGGEGAGAWFKFLSAGTPAIPLALPLRLAALILPLVALPLPCDVPGCLFDPCLVAEGDSPSSRVRSWTGNLAQVLKDVPRGE